jgi:hypothetical protein
VLAGLYRHQGLELPPFEGSAAEALGGLLDFRGTVVLAERLGDPSAASPSAVGEKESADETTTGGDDHSGLHHDVRTGLQAIEEFLARKLRNPSRGMPALPGAAETAETLVELDLPRADNPQTRKRCWDALGQPHATLVGSTVHSLRMDMVGLREGLAPALRTRGDRAAAVEGLDGALRQVINSQTDARYELLDLHLRRCFIAGLARALPSLPEEPQAQDVQNWFEPDGWLATYRQDCADLVQAALTAESLLLQALVHSCIDASGSNPA